MYEIGGLFGTLVIMYLMGRLFMWLLKRMGERPLRVFLAYGLAAAAGFVSYGSGNANGGPWNPMPLGPLYILAAAIWGVVELLAQKGRAAKREELRNA